MDTCDCELFLMHCDYNDPWCNHHGRDITVPDDRDDVDLPEALCQRLTRDWYVSEVLEAEYIADGDE